ncbi:MAG: hypothetical protein V4572_01265 [Bacteroidota bacterium]
MIAYDKTLLDHTFIVEEARKLKKAGFINEIDFKTISTELPTLKSQNNILVRLLFFILGCLLYSSICGLIGFIAVVNNNNNDVFNLLIYLFCAIGIAGIEFMSRENKQYGYGIDDAFLLGAQLCLFIGIAESSDENSLAILIAITIASAISYFRYVHLSSALLFCIGITGSIAILTLDYLIIGKAILSFVMLVFAGSGYFISKKMLANLSVPYYYNGLKLTQAFCLILFYYAGNYYVVRELNANLSNTYYYNDVSPEIPFAVFFWAFTFITPIVYLVYSVKNKDRIMLWIGFPALCFSFFSFRMYHHVLPPEIALTIGGLALFAFTYFAIKKTKSNETGLTFKADRFSDPNAFGNLQTLVVASQFGLKPEVKAEESPMDFGGGGFSGGGSEGSY